MTFLTFHGLCGPLFTDLDKSDHSSSLREMLCLHCLSLYDTYSLGLCLFHPVDLCQHFLNISMYIGLVTEIHMHLMKWTVVYESSCQNKLVFKVLQDFK